MSTTSKRSKYFDNAKFVLIFLVVFGHLISPLKEQDGILFTLYTVIFLFHMPAFIFISGYFAKGFRNKGYLLKSFKKILLPYFIFQIIYSVYYYLVGKEETLHFDFLHPHWSLWFLLSLFFWNVFLYVFAPLRWFGLFVAVLMGIVIGFVDEIGSFLSLSRTFVFFPYFLLGYLLNGDMLKRIIRAKYSLPIGVFILIGTLLFFGLWFPESAVPWLLGATSYANMGGEQVADGVFRGVQYILTPIVIFGFLALIPSSTYKVSEIGERTLYVYLFHGFVIKSLQSVVPDNSLFSFSGYLLLFGVSLLICFTLGSYLTKKFTRPLVELKV
jgi:fucose 4-O-acetylase-like acetyltransferase